MRRGVFRFDVFTINCKNFRYFESYGVDIYFETHGQVEVETVRTFLGQGWSWSTFFAIFFWTSFMDGLSYSKGIFGPLKLIC